MIIIEKLEIVLDLSWENIDNTIKVDIEDYDKLSELINIF